MFYDQNLAVRYPKGPFAMWSVYSFTGASILASIIFSLLLFLSIDDNPLMQLLFGGLAITFELGKFFAWYEVGERHARRNYSGMIFALGFYAVLAAISIGGSVGGINSATNKAQSHVDLQQSKVNAFDMQIAAIDKQIALNNIAAEKYIQMERIAVGVVRIQKENKRLRDEQQKLAMERDRLPLAEQGSVIGLIDGLAVFLNTSPHTAQLGLVVFLSILLDFFAAFFVGLIGEENRFRHQFLSMKPITIDAFTTHEMKEPEMLSHFTPTINSEFDVTAFNEPQKTPYERVRDALSSNQVTCSKRAVVKQLNLRPDEVDKIFTRLFSEGMVTKKANNHFQWQGIEIEG
ncbi:Preprotein translocase subunit SecY [Shewanella sp. D64]|uniref:Preprotein translocase subunit SecY n=1 Tax=unclassified Shewanella TaxID=196818 RepID=UPI0022BA5FBD|nr:MULTISPECIES: Preprotein translocase subunit SecY [unclassified Shewanella]MEC4725790.1 Preprotein translocase subunit SecY [Shewanella sp. D64]MEC4737603.1 Preprotein translocase subunit SecY [Shewanella sp. E94]WBJ93420.1 Preprotein translocase subunit SecY [Shewanella sp. MTB7]